MKLSSLVVEPDDRTGHSRSNQLMHSKLTEMIRSTGNEHKRQWAAKEHGFG